MQIRIWNYIYQGLQMPFSAQFIYQGLQANTTGNHFHCRFCPGVPLTVLGIQRHVFGRKHGKNVHNWFKVLRIYLWWYAGVHRSVKLSMFYCNVVTGKRMVRRGATTPAKAIQRQHCLRLINECPGSDCGICSCYFAGILATGYVFSNPGSV